MTLDETIDEIVERAEASTRDAAAAMADTLRDVTRRYLGGDLTMSGVGSVQIEPEATKGSASVTAGGAYGLADGGRRRAVPARAARGHALRTPWGPRVSVSGSTWAGFDITERAADDVFTAGGDAVTKALR